MTYTEAVRGLLAALAFSLDSLSRLEACLGSMVFMLQEIYEASTEEDDHV